ncbi:MAG: hypothetical protein NTY98_00865 [Verrucomicrobia bacterium]|nr:hypothetical protein [Verrucomicrobiota bacterium]
MKPESLHALVIDQYSGELSPEVADLLEAYLALQPAARKEAEHITETLLLMNATVAEHPECVRVWAQDEIKPLRVPRRKMMLPMWMKAAAVIVFSAFTGAAGFYAGTSRFSAASSAIADVTPVEPRRDSPWARYRMALDPHGHGMQVVRVDLAEREGRP